MSDPIVFIPLANKKGVTVVDFIDFESVRNIVWCAKRNGRIWYAARYFKNERGIWKSQLLHKRITGWDRADHRNGNGLDNRRLNLRYLGVAENLRAFNRKRPNSSSKFRGVCRKPTGKPWMARINLDSKSFYIGRFISEEEAARAYDAAAIRLGYKEEAINFPILKPDNFNVL